MKQSKYRTKDYYFAGASRAGAYVHVPGRRQPHARRSNLAKLDDGFVGRHFEKDAHP